MTSSVVTDNRRPLDNSLPLLEINNLCMSYGPQLVLDDVSMEVYPNEVVGLVGENGAGKSTLLNILSGVTHGYRGEISYAGEPLHLRDPYHGSLKGISRVFQDQALVPTRPVYENLFLSHESHFSRFGVLDRGRQIAAAEEAIANLGLQLDVRRQVGEFDIATRQAIEIARACSLSAVLSSPHRLILLDEPTASLSHHEIAPLFDMIRRLRRQASFIFVSHRLTEALDLCDRIYVLKDGVVTSSAPAKSFNVASLHELMVGRKRDADFYREDLAMPAGPIKVSVDGLSVEGAFNEVSFDLHQGEVLSVVGVLGSGKSALGEAIVGIRRPSKGRVVLDGVDVTRWSFRRHLRLGFGHVPADRAALGIVGTLSGRANISLSSIFDQFSRYGLLRLAAERVAAETAYRKMRIFPPEVELEARFLSGGNQQKLLLSRAVGRAPEVLIVDNPTAGVDAGVKAEIYVIFRELAQAGCAVLVITDDLLEAIGLGDRVAIMRDGRLNEIIDAPMASKPDERTVVQHMV